MPDLRGQLRRELLIAGECLDRIARHQMRDEEGEDRNAEEYWDCLDAAAKDVRDHVEYSCQPGSRL